MQKYNVLKRLFQDFDERISIGGERFFLIFVMLKYIKKGYDKNRYFYYQVLKTFMKNPFVFLQK